MPWVRFIKNYDWQPMLKYVVAYKANHFYLVKKVVAEQAIKEGKAVAIERPESLIHAVEKLRRKP